MKKNDIQKLRTVARGVISWLESGAKDLVKAAGHAESLPERSTESNGKHHMS